MRLDVIDIYITVTTADKDIQTDKRIERQMDRLKDLSE